MKAPDCTRAHHATLPGEMVRMLLRDVANLRGLFVQCAPELLMIDFGPEIRDLYQRGLLAPGAVLNGRFARKGGAVGVGHLMREIDDARCLLRLPPR